MVPALRRSTINLTNVSGSVVRDRGLLVVAVKQVMR
jgi:hypothetical protein